MKASTLAILGIVGLASVTWAEQTGPVEALDGVDPVLLIQGKEVSGKADLKVVRGQFEYLFSSPATKATFESDPARYEIQLGGLCARMGKATGGRPADYLVYQGRIYVFGSDECHKKFEADPKKYLAAPVPPIAASGRSLTDGRALLDRAVATVGGSTKLGAITTYVETASQIQKRPSGDVPVTIKTMWRFPDAVRMERTMTIQERTMSSATLMTPAGMWYLSQGHAYPVLEAGRPSLQLDYGRQIVPLLRASREPGAKIASLGKTTVRGITVERVRVVNGAVDVTLGLDPASARIQSISFMDRNAEGEVGEFTILYSDYRSTSGLTLPFAERALFKDTEDTFLSRRLTAIDVNTGLDAALFQPVAAGGR
jgi:YHS domain-containing protein